MDNNLFCYKYKKYKQKYNLLKQKSLKQKAGSLDELREYLSEASSIFENVDHYGKQDDIIFFINGSVAVLFYFINFIDKYSHLLNESELERINSICEGFLPDDLDIFWIETKLIPKTIFEKISEDIKKRTASRIGTVGTVDISVGQKFLRPMEETVKIADSAKVGSSASGKLPLPILPMPIRPPKRLTFEKCIDNEKGITCNDKPELLVIGSHYSRVPVPYYSIFYKCADRISKYKKIDFSNWLGECNCVYFTYNSVNVRVLGILSLLSSYKSYSREKDRIKIYILRLICDKLNEENEYIGHPVLNIHDEVDL